MTADPEIDAAFLERFNLTLSRAGGPSQLRRATSFSLTAIDNYRTGASEPSRSRLLEIAKAANVSAAWLTTGEGPMEPGGESPLVVAGSERMEG